MWSQFSPFLLSYLSGPDSKHVFICCNWGNYQFLVLDFEFVELEGKSTCCSSREVEFKFQHPCQASSQLPVTPALEDQMPSSGSC